MTTEYHPIDCDRHSVLELLAMRQAEVSLEAESEDAGTVNVDGIVTDVVTRGGAEYLVITNSTGQPVSLRLDRIRYISQGNGQVIWRQ